MKKRLLCYDEDNPVGIDENGVLNPSALQPYYSKKVLFKALTKDDFTKTVVHDVVDMYFYSFGSKLDWLTSEDSIHVEYRIEYNDGEIIESSAPIIQKAPNAPDGSTLLYIDMRIAIMNGVDLMTMELADDCVIGLTVKAEDIKQLKIDLYKVETNKLSGDLVEGVHKVKVYDVGGTNVSNFMSLEIINEIKAYYQKGYLIGLTNLTITVPNTTINPSGPIFIHDIDCYDDANDRLNFTTFVSDGVYRGTLTHDSNSGRMKIGHDFYLSSNYLFMKNPSGTNMFRIQVADDGTISATKV